MLLASLLACATESPGPANAFAAAEAATGVPMEILLAISKVETGVQLVEGQEEFPGQDVTWGVMGLRDSRLEQAAKLSGYEIETIKKGAEANVMAAATLMAAWASDGGIDTNSLSAWAPVVAQYSGIEDEEARREYVWYEVYAALAEGVRIEGFESDPRSDTPDYAPPARSASKTGDASTVWSASPNYNSRSGAGVDYVIVHACEGSYSGCWAWLTNGSSGVSSHYVVNTNGSEVRQLVDEGDRAWHISATYDCKNNGSQDCASNGTSMNTVSVGIEHAGYTAQTSWDAGLVSRSAEIACGVTQRHGVPIDGYHIVGHGQLQPYNRSDPGTGWPWTRYLDEVRAACGSSGSSSSPESSTEPATASSFVIDSNNAANDTSAYSIDISANWTSSANVSGYYNTGYWVAPTKAVSDPAHFRFTTDASRCYTVEAWWTSGSDRPPSITWIGLDERDQEVGRATVNQQTNGGRWNQIGSWTFPSGENQVMLSRWTTTGSNAVADAVRLTPC